MLAKGMSGIGRALREIVSKMQLTAKRISLFDRFSLGSFSLPDGASRYQEILPGLHHNKNAAVIIREDKVGRLNLKIAEAR